MTSPSDPFEETPCICGHAYRSHRTIAGGCRGKDCKCTGFANEGYYEWRKKAIEWAIKNETESLSHLRKRLDDAARRDREAPA